MSLELTTIKFRDYACFNAGEIELTSDFIIVVGQNNAGKSKLLDIINSCGTNKNYFQNMYENIDFRELVDNVVFTTNENFFSEVLPKINEEQSRIQNPIAITTSTGYHIDFLRAILVRSYSCKITFDKKNNAVFSMKFNDLSWGDIVINDLRDYSKVVIDNIKRKRPEICLRLGAERDILPESLSDRPRDNIKQNGVGITSLIASYFHKQQFRDSNADEIILNALNEIISSDYKFDKIFAYSINDKDYEIFLKYENGQKIQISQQGSGLKTILCVLAYLYLMIDESDRHKTLFLFEELENNLHPYVQKKLIQHIYKYSKKYRSRVAITTHSPFVLDTFMNQNDVQVISVAKGENKSKFTSIKAKSDLVDVMSSIGVKPSDILQSNFIIWVEGPSDRIYINKWLEIISGGVLKEHIHYECLFYGGANLAHITTETTLSELINIINVNPNAAIIFDSDKSKEEDDIKPSVRRILDESRTSKIMTWVTECREVECYIHSDLLVGLDPDAALAEMLGDKTPISRGRQAIKNGIQKYENYAPYFQKETNLKQEMDKVPFAKLIAHKTDHLRYLNVYDLLDKIKDIARRVCKANDLISSDVLKG